MLSFSLPQIHLSFCRHLSVGIHCSVWVRPCTWAQVLHRLIEHPLAEIGSMRFLKINYGKSNFKNPLLASNNCHRELFCFEGLFVFCFSSFDLIFLSLSPIGRFLS